MSDTDPALTAASKLIYKVRNDLSPVINDGPLGELVLAARKVQNHRCADHIPEPAPTFEIGQIVYVSAEFDALPYGTVVRTASTGRTAEKFAHAWSATSLLGANGHAVHDSELTGAKIIYLPE